MMKAQRTIQAQKKTLFLMLLITCMAAVAAGTMTATAKAATAHAGVTAAACLRSPPVEGTGTDQAVQPPPTAPCDAILRFRLAPVNTSGVIARSRTFARVDEAGTP